MHNPEGRQECQNLHPSSHSRPLHPGLKPLFWRLWSEGLRGTHRRLIQPGAPGRASGFLLDMLGVGRPRTPWHTGLPWALTRRAWETSAPAL